MRKAESVRAFGKRLANSMLRLLPRRMRNELREVLKGKLDRILHGRRAQKKQIVICGYPRSGTSLFFNMLSTTLSGFQCDEWERSAFETIRQYDNHVSKSPLDTFSIRNLSDCNLHHKTIVVFILLRDIRDIITSVHPNVPDRYFMGYEACCRVLGQFPDYKVTDDLPGVSDYFQEIEQLKNSAEYQVRLLKYEDLVRDPDGMQKEIAKEFDLPFMRRFSEFHLHKDQHSMRYEGTRQPLDPKLVKEDKEVDASGIGRWRAAKHRQRIHDQFAQYPHLFEILRTYGYAENDDWFQDYIEKTGAGEKGR